MNLINVRENSLISVMFELKRIRSPVKARRSLIKSVFRRGYGAGAIGGAAAFGAALRRRVLSCAVG